MLYNRGTIVIWRQTMKSVGFNGEFKYIGYACKNNSPVSPITLPNYAFDPTIIDLTLLQIDDNDDDTEER